MMLTDGHMGDGKTFAAVSLAYEFMHGYSALPVYLATNIAFKQRTADGFTRKAPPNTFYVTSLEATLRVASELMAKHGFGKFILIWILDEAQNFMKAESHLTPLTQDIYTMMANIRKFGICAWLLTPASRYLGPKVRTGPVTGDPDGLITTIWRKDMQAIRNYLIAHRIDQKEAKRFTTVKWKPDMPPYVVYVPSVPWTQQLDSLPIGGYAYETGAISTFTLGSDGFSLSSFLHKVADADDVATAALAYFERIDSKDPDPETPVKDPLEDLCLRVDREKNLGLTWKQICRIEDMKYSTVRGQYNSFFDRNPSLKILTASKLADSGTAMSTRAKSKAEGVLTTEDLLEYPAPLFPPGAESPDGIIEAAENIKPEKFEFVALTENGKKFIEEFNRRCGAKGAD
jgi:hypothetical protein